MKDSTKIVVIKVMLSSVTCLTGKIATLVFDGGVEIAPQEVEAVRGLNLQGIFNLSQAKIFAELNHNLMISILIYFCNQTWFQNPCHI